MIGIDPELVDPEGGDFRLQPGSPAVGYGCQTFGSGPMPAPEASGIDRFTARPVHRALEVSGPVTTDTVWDADTVRVLGDVSVAEGVTLTVPAGVHVEFSDYYALTISGRLLARGEPNRRIRFTSRDPASFAIDSTLAGAWGGIRFPFTSEVNGVSILEYCVIEFAKNAGDSLRGGGLQLNGFSKLRVVNSILRRNVADFGGAVGCTHGAAPEFVGCLITENRAFNGGSAVHCADAYPRFINCTIVGNEDLNSQILDPAAAIYAHLSKPHLTSCILRDNPSLYFEPTQILYGKGYYTTWSNIELAWPGLGNIDADARFAGYGDHPYRLMADSPCIDAGLPDTTGTHLPSLDLGGGGRLLDGRVDMGAYEGGVALSEASAAGVPSPLRVGYGLEGVSIGFDLEAPQSVRLAILDSSGRLISLLADGRFPPGSRQLVWAHEGIPAGVYFANLAVPTRAVSRKIVIAP